MLSYSITATLGPASQTPEIWQAMLSAGVTRFRLNTSHLTLPQLDSWLERCQPFLTRQEQPPALVLDLQGSKWRLGQFPEFELREGERIDLVEAAAADQALTLPVPHPDFFRAASASGGELVLNDAKSRLVIESASPRQLRARVLLGGTISANKGITLAHSEFRKESLNPKDQAILERTRGLDWVRYALSYVRDAAEMAAYRALFGPSALLIAKLERQPALAEAEAVAASADELWLCRGDLGAELGPAGMASAAYAFTRSVPRLRVPAVLAGQVFEHLSQHPSPTRSEVYCLYDALQSGYTGLVLSDETAIGRYPLEACRAAALFLSSGA